MRAGIRCIAFSAAISLIASATSAQQTYSGPWGRGIHVFGHLVLDFGWGTERAGIFSSPLSDCSTEQFFCAASREINLVVPRQCAKPRVGQQWTVGNVSTRVLAVGPAAQGHLPAPGETFVLGTEGQPNVVYGYKPRAGITWVVYDPARSIDFAAMAKSGKFGEYLATASRLGKGAEYYYPLTTLDAVARCH